MWFKVWPRSSKLEAKTVKGLYFELQLHMLHSFHIFQMDVLEDPVFQNVILLQTVLQEVGNNKR